MDEHSISVMPKLQGGGTSLRLLCIHLRACQSPEFYSATGVNGNLDWICTTDSEATNENQQNKVRTKPDPVHGSKAKHESFWNEMSWSDLTMHEIWLQSVVMRSLHQVVTGKRNGMNRNANSTWMTAPACI